MGDKACEVYSAAQENGLFLYVSARGCTGTVSRTISRCSLTKSRGTSRPLIRSMEHVGGYHFFHGRWLLSAATIFTAPERSERVYAG